MANPTSHHRPIGTIALTALLVGATLAHAGAMPLSKEEQARVNRAVEEGAAYLKRTQGAQGTWAGAWEIHTVGFAVLPGLTLLECGVPVDDPVIRKVAAAVRRDGPKLDFTYEIALTILFLDRLGDPQDRELIRTLAVRLIVGQRETGGWYYQCPFPTKKTQEEILATLRQLDPPEQPMEAIRRPAAPLEKVVIRQPGAAAAGGAPQLPKAAPVRPTLPAKKEAKADEQPREVSAALKKMPVFRDPDDLLKRLGKGRMTYITDNSNTQFALLALWVAQRHGVTAQRSMRMIVRRFVTSQNADGGWGYGYRFGGGEPEKAAMTCVGLLGLAVGYGITNPGDDDPNRKPSRLDRIRAGFTALSKHVGRPTGTWRKLPMEDLYFLWSVERVGVLYSLPTIGENDWYRWGAEILIANQQKRGFWTGGGYPKSCSTLDTCLALLFLKRANFVADLTAKLQFKADDLNLAIRRDAAPPAGQSRNPTKP